MVAALMASCYWIPIVSVWFLALGKRNKLGRPRPSNSNYKRTDHLLLQRLALDKKGVVWVDLENVRGKSGFGLSHWEVLTQTAQWSNYHNLTGQVIVVADHGSLSTAYYCSHNDDDDDDHQNQKQNHALKDLGIVFSGNYRKADDVLAQSVGLDCLDRAESIVITADTELQSRCRRASRGSLHIMDPAKFLDDLEATTTILKSKDDDDGQNLSIDNGDVPTVSLEEQLQLGKLDDEIRLRAQILDLQVQLDRKGKRLTNKRRNKLQTKLTGLQSKLSLKGPSILDQVTSLADNPTTDSSNSAMSSSEQELLLQRWKEIQTKSNRKEQTGDRVVLAEQLRRQLLEEAGATTHVETCKLPAQVFVAHFNGDLPNDPLSASSVTPSTSPSTIMSGNLKDVNNLDEFASTSPTTIQLLGDIEKNPLRGLDTVRIVAISDTHGFEGQLLSHPAERDEESSKLSTIDQCEILPKGDILLHLGDFTCEGSPEKEKQSLEALDSWMSQQPHPIKIVVRGNHDPWAVHFQRSGAWYVSKPLAISLQDDLTLGVIPFGTPRSLSATKSMPTACDILATHVPPFKVLDRTFTNKNAGSPFLVKTVREMKEGGPSLWFCGHIHEGRGVTERQFSKEGPSTTIVNAANANGGRATHLEHGVAVVDIQTAAANSKDVSKGVEVISMEDQTIEKMVAQNDFFAKSNGETQEGTKDLLLAVDLGLKSGVSLFSQDGCLLRYEQFYFNKDGLERTVKVLLEEWERDANGAVNGEAVQGLHDRSRITHLAIEGATGYMLRAWADAAPSLAILRVSPEEWRSELLLNKERSSGSNAKAASRLIARQVVEDFGVMEKHQGKFPTDVAEAVCLGLYVSLKLGWIDRETSVRRYTNGNVVVPRK